MPEQPPLFPESERDAALICEAVAALPRLLADGARAERYEAALREIRVVAIAIRSNCPIERWQDGYLRLVHLVDAALEGGDGVGE